MRSLHTITIAVACSLLVGCHRFQTEYGDTKGLQGRSSINGFAGFRSTIENAGCATNDVQRLSERTARNDSIVWIPRALGPIENEVTDWLDGWLAEGDHTLVYVLPDSGSEVDYWKNTRPLAPPTQRLEYRRREADAINQRMTWRLRRRSPPSNGWFQVTAKTQSTRVQSLSGPWTTETELQQAKDSTTTGFSIEYRVGPFDKTINDKVNGITPAFFPNMQTGPSAGTTSPWMPYEQVTVKSDSVETTGLLTTSTGDMLVGEVTSPDWPNSRVLVVAGGSMLTNFALTDTTNRAIARRLAKELSSTRSDSPSNVAMLVTSTFSVPVREATTGPPTSSGMELLSVWPISLVTIHFAILGLLSCLILLPIFGRPRTLRRRSPSNFADHLDAVAALMARADDREFAMSRVDEYVRTVRGESPSIANRPEDGTANTHSAQAATNL